MSGNTSRKYKQYKLMQERRQLFDEICAKDEFGRVDLVAFDASQGRVVTNSPKFNFAKMTTKK